MSKVKQPYIKISGAKVQIVNIKGVILAGAIKIS